MFYFFTHAALLVWSVLFFIVGSILLLILAGLIAHEAYVIMSRLLTNPKNEENLS